MNDIRGPGELNFESTNLFEAWAKWKRSMQYYLVATCKDRSEDEKVAIFMCMIGRQGQDIRDTFELDEDKDGEEIVTVEILIQKFEQYCKPRKNLIVERHRFLTRNQEQSETIDQYVTELKTLATSCEWGDIKDDLICSRIVSGIVSTRVRERLIREPKLKLTRAIEICQADELSLQQLKLFNNDKEVGAINKTRQPRRKYIPKNNPEARKPRQDRDESKTWKTCTNCGNKHPKQKCPAFGRQCNKCKKFNHYAKMCRSSGKLDAIETKYSKPDETGDDFLFLDTITAAVDETKTQSQNQAEYATLSVNNTEVKLKLDTGAEVNVIPIRTYKALATTTRIQLRKPTVNLVAYNGKPVPVKAVCNLQCKYRGEEYDLEFYISESPSEPVLSIAACKELNLVKFTQELKSELVDGSFSMTTQQVSEDEYSKQIRKEYADVFSGLGRLSRPYHMEVDPMADPVIHPPRKVPHPLRDQLAETLENMVKQGVLQKVDGPSDWVNSMVVVQKKDGSLRICIDPKDLNRALKREHHQLPTIEEITARMPGARYFSTLDARSGYWQIPLDEESSKLTTFNTPFGRFRFTRMPFGIRSAQEVFHKRVHEIFEDIRGVETDIDDILVWGRTLQEHDSYRTCQKSRHHCENCSRMMCRGIGLKYMQVLSKRSKPFLQIQSLES
ncbi:Hypothetical predicted protein [Paramuricea clavata]|uniref:Reverse transcriptase domain-containing protein n=1 Tax=Paramuricea clavata TaxID=317549 RepID=A0A7D9HIM5_PARCT|nr:Hypothetical predicted protein [Paramuricea clavata]